MKYLRLLALIGGLTSQAGGQVHYVATPRGPLPRQPYAAYTVNDSLGRVIEFYLSERTDTTSLPLIVYVHGSGHQSHFQQVGGRIVPANGHATLGDIARGRARLLIVEKPGVTRFETGTTAPSEEFRFEHTLDRWAEAVAAATLAARRLPGIDSTRLLIVGHSEGGLVAARVAARLRGVSHVGILAGGGPSQLFDLRQLAREGKFFAEVSGDPARREAWLLAQWDSILADPESATRDFFGHPFRRWASFLRDSPIEELDRTSARVFVAQGSADAVVSRASFDSLVSHLTRLGPSPTVRLVAGADHSFAIQSAGAGPRDGWTEILATLLEWFLQ